MQQYCFHSIHIVVGGLAVAEGFRFQHALMGRTCWVLLVDLGVQGAAPAFGGKQHPTAVRVNVSVNYGGVTCIVSLAMLRVQCT